MKRRLWHWFVHGVAIIVLVYGGWYISSSLVKVCDAFWNINVFQPYGGIYIPFVGLPLTVLTFIIIGAARELLSNTELRNIVLKHIPVVGDILYEHSRVPHVPDHLGCVLVKFRHRDNPKAVLITSIQEVYGGEYLVGSITLQLIPGTEMFMDMVEVQALHNVAENGIVQYRFLSLKRAIQIEMTAGVALPPGSLADLRRVSLRDVLIGEGLIPA